MTSTSQPFIIQAAQQGNSYLAATQYAQLGLSITPLQGKRPSLNSWKQYQQGRPSCAPYDGISNFIKDDTG